MKILTNFNSVPQIAEHEGRFYIIAYPEAPSEPDTRDILKEITAETLYAVLRNIDNTEGLDFRPHDLRGISERAYLFELLEEQERLKAEHYAEQHEADDRMFSVNGKPVDTSATED